MFDNPGSGLPFSSLRRCVLQALILCPLFLADISVQPTFGWGKGHKIIRQWAVARLPEWQQELLSEEEWGRLVNDYSSLQDQHAGGNSPHLDRYCLPPQRLSLHDVGRIEASLPDLEWYLAQIIDHFERGETDEALKYLGVLCHWNEDPGCPSAHSSPVNETTLRMLLPPPDHLANKNYLFGYGGIADAGTYSIPSADYQPQLLGTTIPEAAARIYQHQKKLRQFGGSQIVPLVQAVRAGDSVAADETRQKAAEYNARHVADLLFTVFSLCAQRFEDQAANNLSSQPLTEWLPEARFQMVPHPYYVTPFLVNQAMDASRKLHPLQLTDGNASKTDVEFGFGTGAPTRITYQIGPGAVFERLTTRAGLHPTAGQQAAVTFAVFINGSEAARSPALTPADAPYAFDVPIPQTEIVTLELLTIPAKESVPNHNLAVWGEPTLQRAESLPFRRDK